MLLVLEIVEHLKDFQLLEGWSIKLIKKNYFIFVFNVFKKKQLLDHRHSVSTRKHIRLQLPIILDPSPLELYPFNFLLPFNRKFLIPLRV